MGGTASGMVAQLDFLGWGPPGYPQQLRELGGKKCFVWGVAMEIAGLSPGSQGAQWEGDWVPH